MHKDVRGNVIYYWNGLYGNVAHTKIYNCGSSIYLPVVLYFYSRYWADVFKQRHINWKRSAVSFAEKIWEKIHFQHLPPSPPKLHSSYSCIFCTTKICIVSMRGIVLECVKPSTTDEITKREYILQCLNPQMIFLYVRVSFLENTNCNVYQWLQFHMA